MAILTDVLVASASEAEAICRCSGGHFENWPCWQAKGFDNLIFSDLLRALGAEADAESLSRGDTLILNVTLQFNATVQAAAGTMALLERVGAR